MQGIQGIQATVMINSHLTVLLMYHSFICLVPWLCIYYLQKGTRQTRNKISVKIFFFLHLSLRKKLFILFSFEKQQIPELSENDPTILR